MSKTTILLAAGLFLALTQPMVAKAGDPLPTARMKSKTASEAPALSDKTEKAAMPVAAKLSETEKADLARMEAYFNDNKSVSADFLQVSDSGNLRYGKISISRPGKMRVTYKEPDKDFIVSDGLMLHMWDDEMGQQTNVPIGDGIADFILRDPIKLISKDVTITRFARYPAKIEVSLVSNETPGEGELTLVFEDKPLKLRQWRVLDAQGRTTGVNLENVRSNVTFPKNEFVFVSPKFGEAKDGSR